MSEIKTHETFVIGVNDKSEIVFLKSYHYPTQKQDAQSDLKWVIDNCDSWHIGAMSEYKIIHENDTHNIVIPHP